MAASESNEALLPAPGRGQYDRALTRERRQAEQRERLLIATAAAFVRDLRSVSGVTALAGVGRNTFYEYFDDFEHALDAVATRAQSRLELVCAEALARARTPIARLRAICRGWCGALLELGDEALVLLCARPRTPEHPLSAAGRVLAASFESAHSGSRAAAQDPSAILATAAAAEALLLGAIGARAEPDPTAALVARIAVRLLH